MSLDLQGLPADPQAWAEAVGASVEACELLASADFIDLHCDVEVPARLYGYDPARRHPTARRPAIFFGHTDFPRMIDAGLTGVVYDIATNPIRPEANRQATTLSNLERVVQRVAAHPEHLDLVRDRAGYDRARAAGRMAVWVSLQGGNALAAEPDVLEGPVGELLHRITLVHLTTSVLGGTSSPMGWDKGLTDRGREMIARCNAARVLVDLAHAGKRTFWGALEAHDPHIPPLVSHTGVEGVRPHWRNLDDEQIRAIADRGGVVGIMYQSSFLSRVLLYARRAAIVDHLEHVIEVAGEDVPAIGTDYDGMIVPPRDLPDITSHPLLVQDMLQRGWSETRIRKILGLNYLRLVEQLRPGTPQGTD